MWASVPSDFSVSYMKDCGIQSLILDAEGHKWGCPFVPLASLSNAMVVAVETVALGLCDVAKPSPSFFEESATSSGA